MNPGEKSLHISMPEPCHEDWDGMTPAERGRHCAVCDKVVRDFTASSEAEIQQTLAAVPNLCGRFRADQLQAPDLPAEFFFRYPLQRLRRFLIAFLLVFGFEALGFSDAVAQQLNDELELVQQEGQLVVEETGIQNEQVHLEGLVLDAEFHEPVPFATVVVKSGGQVVAGALSDAEGKFNLDFARRDLKAYHYDLLVSYGGKERMKKRVETDVEEVLVLIDPTVLLEPVVIRHLKYDPTALGAPLPVETIESMVGLIYMGSGVVSIALREYDMHYYHELEPFLMMRNAEVNMSGTGARW